jgi:hypothetical protein
MVLAAALVVAACGSTPTGPSGSNNSTPVLQSLAISCLVSTLTEASQVTQCTATGNLSNGQTQSRTLDSTWESSDPSVATVSSSGTVIARTNGTTTISATYQGVRGTRSVTVNIPLSIVTWNASISVSQPFFIGYRVTGTIDVTLNRAISPPPSKIRAEFEASQTGGTINYSAGATQLHWDFSQDTVACPNFPVSGEFLRLIDVAQQVTLVRAAGGWSGTLANLCRAAVSVKVMGLEFGSGVRQGVNPVRFH